MAANKLCLSCTAITIFKTTLQITFSMHGIEFRVVVYWFWINQSRGEKLIFFDNMFITVKFGGKFLLIFKYLFYCVVILKFMGEYKVI